MIKKLAFTLIELSIVLIVMGIIVGSSAKIFTTMAKNSKIKETKELLELLTHDIEGFAQAFKRMPTSNEVKNFYMRTKDSWGKEIFYVAAPNLTKTICDQNRTNLQHIQDKKHVKNLGFMLISSGPNRNTQTAIIKNDQFVTVKTAKYYQIVDFNKDKLSKKEPFDDIYIARTVWSLRWQLKCQ